MSINYFDEIFFSKYIKDEDEVLDVCHKHSITIINTIVIYIFFWAILPSFFYYNNSLSLQDNIPFIYYEIYLFLIYIVILYRIFDWYNDVWIITNKWIIDLDWQFLKTNIVYIDYNDVKWIEIHQDSMWDWILNKWDVEIHLDSEWWDFGLSDAKSPWEIVSYIQWILEDKEKAKKEKEKTLTDKLFSTLRWVVGEYLEKEWLKEFEEEVEITPEEKDLNKALKKKWTIDLRFWK